MLPVLVGVYTANEKRFVISFGKCIGTYVFYARVGRSSDRGYRNPMLGTAYLRLVLLVIVGSYFPFLALSALMDWKLAKECIRVGIRKPASFIDHRSTSRALVAHFVEVLRRKNSRFAIWLTIWEFVSDAYFWLLIAFLGMVIAAIVSNLIGVRTSLGTPGFRALLADGPKVAWNLMVL